MQVSRRLPQRRFNDHAGPVGRQGVQQRLQQFDTAGDGIRRRSEELVQTVGQDHQVEGASLPGNAGARSFQIERYSVEPVGRPATPHHGHLLPQGLGLLQSTAAAIHRDHFGPLMRSDAVLREMAEDGQRSDPGAAPHVQDSQGPRRQRRHLSQQAGYLGEVDG